MPFTLPDLPYDHAALEPTIDARTMEIHHGKHHQAYVDNANKALEGTEWADNSVESVLASLDALPDDIRTAVRNNAGGHANHSLFWEIMSPDGGGEPEGELKAAIDDLWGSTEELKTGDQRRRRQALRQRLDVAGLRRHRPRGQVDAEPGQPVARQRRAAPRHRRLGARLLPQLPEPPPGLPGGVVERGQLGRGRPPLRRGGQAPVDTRERGAVRGAPRYGQNHQE